MAVVNKGIITASGSATGSLERGVRREFTRTYQLVSDNIVTDDENAVLAAVGINLYSAHPTYSLAWVTDIKVDLQEVVYQGTAGPNGAIWHATVEYGWLDPLIRATDGNPLNAPILWDVRYEAEEIPLYQDATGDPLAIPPTVGNPIVNKAYDYFDPPVTIDRQRGILSVYKNVGSIDAVTLDKWGNCVNAGIWNTFPVKTLLLKPIEIPQRQYDQATDTVFWPLVFQFAIRNPDTWKKVVLNQGYRELKTVSGTTTRRQVFVDGIPASSPVLLSSTGAALVPPVASSAVVYLSFDVYPTLDFSLLGLNTIPDFPTS